MKVSEAFPSKYLSAADLNGNNVRAIMQHVEMEKLGDDNKPVLYFKGKTKGLALNVTNCRTIAAVYGDEMNDWRDQEIILFTAMVDFQGKTVEAIRVRAPQPKDNPRPAPAPQRQTGGISDAAMADDDIPF